MTENEGQICPLCGEELSDYYHVTRWIHDIINHREYWEGQNELSSKDHVMKFLYEIIEHHCQRFVSQNHNETV